MLGPLEAFNGILMFGVSTAVMTAAVNYVVRHDIVSSACSMGDDGPVSQLAGAVSACSASPVAAPSGGRSFTHCQYSS